MPLPRYNTFRSTFKSRYLTITFKIQKSDARLSPTVVPKHFASGATTTTHIASKVAFFPLCCSSKQSMTHIWTFLPRNRTYGSFQHHEMLSWPPSFWCFPSRLFYLWNLRPENQTTVRKLDLNLLAEGIETTCILKLSFKNNNTLLANINSLCDAFRLK